MSKDMLHARCKKCGKGTYEEWSLWCDWAGTPLKCNKCKHSMPRWPKPEVPA